MPRFLPCAICVYAITSLGAGPSAGFSDPHGSRHPRLVDRPVAIQETVQDAELEKQVKKLIEDLGDDDYVVRESSHQKLLEMGVPCLEWLRLASSAPDSEVRFRIRRLVRLIEISGYENRLSQFLNSKDPAKSFGLAGWKKFSGLIGTEMDARELFVSFHKRFPKAMEALDKSGTEINRQFKLISTTEIDNKRYTPGLRSEKVMEALICNLLLASSVAQNQSSRLSMDSRISNWLADAQLRGLGKQDGGPELFKKSIAIWLSQSKKFDQQTAQKLSIAINLGLTEESWRYAKLCLDPANSSSATFRTQAILFIRDQGDESHVEILKKHLKDTNRGHQIYQSGTKKRVNVQVRDSALEALLKIRKLKPADFGMVKFDLSNYSSNQLLPNFGFENDDQRKKAFEKWITSNKTSK